MHPFPTKVNDKLIKMDMVVGHMAVIPFPVLCKCRNVLKKTKTTKITIQKDFELYASFNPKGIGFSLYNPFQHLSLLIMSMTTAEVG